MATEAIPDPVREAMKFLHSAILTLESGDPHGAENAAHTAIAWLRECPSGRPVKPTASATV
jgi:hypothetical protein